MSDDAAMSSLSKEAKELLGTNHPIWDSFLGDMRERKIKVLNEIAACGQSAGSAQAVARFPTQMQEVVLRLLTEKNLTRKEIRKKTGISGALIQTTTTFARRLGYLEPSTHGNSYALSKAREAYRKSSERRRLEKKLAEEVDVMIPGFDRGDRQSFRPEHISAVLKARKLLNGEGKPNPSHTHTPAPEPQAVPHVIATAEVEKDPTKRVVEVSLRMTVEELDDFVKTVNAKKAEATAG